MIAGPVAASFNATATLLEPGKLPDPGFPSKPHSDGRAGAGSMTVMNSEFADLALGVVDGPIGPQLGGHSAPAAQWVLLNNQFQAAAQRNWSVAALVLAGFNATPGHAGPPRPIMLDGTAAAAAPRSQLLFGPGW